MPLDDVEVAVLEILEEVVAEDDVVLDDDETRVEDVELLELEEEDEETRLEDVELLVLKAKKC